MTDVISLVGWLEGCAEFNCGLDCMCLCCRSTCENVVRVLRSNKDSVMAMLEAFVHDPLINWRLLNTTTDAVDAGNTPTGDSSKCCLTTAASEKTTAEPVLQN